MMHLNVKTDTISTRSDRNSLLLGVWYIHFYCSPDWLISAIPIKGVKTTSMYCEITKLLYINKKLQQTDKKNIRTKHTKVSLWILLPEFKFVKHFVVLLFILESTDRYKVFHMAHSWQLCCCSLCRLCCDLMNRNWITTKWNCITFHMWLKIACEMGLRSLRQPNPRKVDQLWKGNMYKPFNHAYP